MAMTVMVELRVSSPHTEHLVHHVHAVDPRRLLVKTNMCRGHSPGLLAPRHRVHEGEPHDNVRARGVHDRLAVSLSTQSLKSFRSSMFIFLCLQILE